jgi:hypothetical protein
MEEAAGVLSKQERLTLLRLLKKLGKGGENESRGLDLKGSRRRRQPASEPAAAPSGGNRAD